MIGDIGSPNNVLTLSEHDCDVFTALSSDDTSQPSLPAADKSPSPSPSMSHFLYVDFLLFCWHTDEAVTAARRNCCPLLAVCS